MNNQRYSILIVAFECQYSHVERFIKYLKYVNPQVEITLFADDQVISDDIKNNVADIIYKKYFTDKHRIKNKLLSKLLNRGTLFLQFRKLASTRRFDIVNIHFAQFYMCFVMRSLHLMSNNVILSPWGSDILRVKSKIKRALLKQTYRSADMITEGPQGAMGVILNKEFGVDENRLVPLVWGSETIDFINDNLDRISPSDAKKKLALDGKYVITCGYNAFQEQRHLEIINALAKIKKQLPSNIVLLFPATYGIKKKKADYIRILKDRCEEEGFAALFFEQYLSVEDVFYLRRASDMFIHVQTTDAGNSTIMEYCICGNKIVHGSWLYYKWLDYPPRFYFAVDDMDALPSVILTAYQSEQPVIPEEVLSMIKSRGWKQKMMVWNDAFMARLT